MEPNFPEQKVPNNGISPHEVTNVEEGGIVAKLKRLINHIMLEFGRKKHPQEDQPTLTPEQEKISPESTIYTLIPEKESIYVPIPQKQEELPYGGMTQEEGSAEIPLSAEGKEEEYAGMTQEEMPAEVPLSTEGKEEKDEYAGMSRGEIPVQASVVDTSQAGEITVEKNTIHTQFRNKILNKYGKHITTVSQFMGTKGAEALGKGKFKEQWAIQRKGKESDEIRAKTEIAKQQAPQPLDINQANNLLRNPKLRERLGRFFMKAKGDTIENRDYKKYNKDAIIDAASLLMAEETKKLTTVTKAGQETVAIREQIREEDWAKLSLEQQEQVTTFLSAYVAKTFLVAGMSKGAEQVEGATIHENIQDEILRVLQIRQKIDARFDSMRKSLEKSTLAQKFDMKLEDLHDLKKIDSLIEKMHATLPRHEILPELEKFRRFLEGSNYITLPSVIWDDSQQKFHLVTELKSGSCAGVFNDLTNEDHCKILHDVARGLEFLHDELGISHNDLAARNVFLFWGPNGVEVSLGDYGMASPQETHANEHKEDFLPLGNVGPIKWMGKERLHRLVQPKSDLWSFGILARELIKKGDPYPDLNNLQCAEETTGGKQGKDNQRFFDYNKDMLSISDNSLQLLKDCMLDVNGRPNYRELSDALVEDLKNVTLQRPSPPQSPYWKMEI